MPDELISNEASVPQTYQAPDPIKTTPREAPREAPKPLSIRETMEKNRVKIEAEAPKELKTKEPAKAPVRSDAKTETKAPAKAETKPVERSRGEHGHFVADPSKSDAENEVARTESQKAPARTESKGDTDHRQPLQRFSQAAKDNWGDVPEETQKEVYRAIRELEAGLNKHRQASMRYSDAFAEYDNLARASGLDARATLQGYVMIDKALHSGDPQQVVGAINEVLNAAGIHPAQYAQAIMSRYGGQEQQQDYDQPIQPDPEVTDLRRRVADLQRQLGGVTQHIQGEIQTGHEQTLTQWSADKPHFEKLRGEVTRLVRDEGLSPDDAYASALVTAQDVARELLGDSAFRTPSSRNPFDQAAQELAEQIDKGSKSISGAASAGSTPPRKSGPLPSIKESIRRSASRLA